LEFTIRFADIDFYGSPGVAVDIPDVRVFHTEITNPGRTSHIWIAYLFRQHTTNSAFILPHGDLLICVDRSGSAYGCPRDPSIQ
jgi:hypothetical protein